MALFFRPIGQYLCGIEHTLRPPGIQDLFRQAKLHAQQSGKTATLTFDQAENKFSAEEKADPNAMDSSNTSFASVTMPESCSADTFVVSGSDVDGSEFKVSFYPDGSATPSQLGVTVGGRQVAIKVSGDGQISVASGEVDNQQTDEWEAGDIETRTCDGRHGNTQSRNDR